MNLKIHQLNFTVGDIENNFLKIKQNYDPNFQVVTSDKHTLSNPTDQLR